MRLIGYAYDADAHCEGCTLDRFGPDISTAEDSEWNEIHPIYDIDENLDVDGDPAPMYCGYCRDELG